MSEKNKPILCLDFDGVIHSYTSGWKGASVIPDPPVEGAIAFMLEALLHFDVVIYSSRSKDEDGLKAMKAWLYDYGGQTWYESPAGPGLEDIEFAAEKPAAFLTIDDRAICFSGNWNDYSPELLLHFKPWNKQ